MDLKDYLAISGHRGLFKYISQARNGIIVEGLEDKKRMNAFTHYKVSSLKDIAIFTDSEEVPLQKVFKIISELGKDEPVPEGKTEDCKLKEFFAKILPNYNREKVYVSDIRKIVGWYTILKENGITNFDEDKEESKEDQTSGNNIKEPDPK
jgi:Domain of unknown function (DUF5606)